jgi:regulator of replication initiation timing
VEAAREKYLKEAVRERDKARGALKRMEDENAYLKLEVARLKRQELTMAAERETVPGRVESAFKLGRAQRMLEEAQGK